MGPRDSAGLSFKIGIRATPKGKTTVPSLQSGTERGDLGINPRASPKRGGNEGGGRGGFLLHPIPSPQKRWQSETSHKSKSPERLRTDTSLQDGRNPHIEGTSQAGEIGL